MTEPPDFLGETDPSLQIEELERSRQENGYDQIGYFIDMIEVQIAIGVSPNESIAMARQKLQALRQRAIARGFI